MRIGNIIPGLVSFPTESREDLAGEPILALCDAVESNKSKEKRFTLLLYRGLIKRSLPTIAQKKQSYAAILTPTTASTCADSDLAANPNVGGYFLGR